MKCKYDDGTPHFSESLKSEFQFGGFHPFCFGAFGERNQQTKVLIKLCTKYVAAKKYNYHSSALDDSMTMGTAYHVIRTQFKKEVGITASRILAQIKLQRTSYIRSSKAKAATAEDPNDYKFYSDHTNQHLYQNNDNREHFRKEFYAYHTQYQE